MTRLAGAEHGSRVSQMIIYPRRGRVRATEHAPRDPFRLLERRHGLSEIVERGIGVQVERRRVRTLHLERGSLILSKNTLRHGYRSA